MYELALFAGAGLGVWGSRLIGLRTVCYVERDPYCVKVIHARIQEGYFDNAPIWSDVRSFTTHNNQCRRFIRGLRKLAGELVVTGGFPCQPFSSAGNRLGVDDPRNAWPETIRVIREIRPAHLLLENVSGLVSHPYFETILGDLAASGYDYRWDCIPASAIGANHQRDRLWIVAHANDSQWRSATKGRDWSNRDDAGRKETPGRPGFRGETGRTGDMAHTDSGQREPAEDQVQTRWDIPDPRGTDVSHPHLGGLPDAQDREAVESALPGRADAAQGGGIERLAWWEVEPGLGRMVDGCANWRNRIRTLGQGQVPGVVRAAWEALSR